MVLFEEKVKPIRSQRIFMKYLIILVSLFTLSCNFKRRIEDRISIGSPLTKDIIFNANQIIKYKENLVIVFNFSDRVEVHDLYLLFFDKNRKLIDFCEFFSQKIELIKNDTIFCLLNENKYESRLFKLDKVLPFEYKIQLIKSNSINQGISNKIIEDISFLENEDSVLIKLRTYDSKVISNHSNNFTLDSNFLKENHQFKKEKTKVGLNEILFNFESEDIVSLNYTNDNSQLILDDFLFLDSNKFTSFKEEVWLTLMR